MPKGKRANPIAPRQPVLDRGYTIQEAAKYCGRSVVTIKNWLYEREILKGYINEYDRLVIDREELDRVLDSFGTQAPRQPILDAYHYDEAAAYCGVSYQTIWKWVNNKGLLQGKKDGERLVFTQDELDRILDTLGNDRFKRGPKNEKIAS